MDGGYGVMEQYESSRSETLTSRAESYDGNNDIEKWLHHCRGNRRCLTEMRETSFRQSSTDD